MAETPRPESVSPEAERCAGTLIEGGEVVCRCAHGFDGVCGYQVDGAPLPEQRMVAPIDPVFNAAFEEMTALLAERDVLRKVLKEYGQHKPECKAPECAACGDFKPGTRLEDGYCSTDKYGLHVWRPKPCTCGFAALARTEAPSHA